MEYMLILNVILLAVVAAFCADIGWRWRKRHILMLEFLPLGASQILSFLAFYYWLASNSQPMLIAAAAFSVLMGTSLSSAVIRMLYSPRIPRNWFLSAYVFIPVIYMMTSSVQVTCIQTITISTLVTSCSFFLILMIGKCRIRMYAVSGMLAGLVAMVYMYSVISGTGMGLPWVFVSALSLFAYFGLWKISRENPKCFVADYNAKKDKP